MKFLKMVKNSFFSVMKKNIIFTWVLSYLFIMLLSVICNGIIYYRAKAAIRYELAINSVQAMDKFKIMVDNIFVNISGIANTIRDDETVFELCNMPKQAQYNQYSGTALSATGKLQKLLASNPSLSEIYIYYKNIDLVTGSHYMYTKKRFYDQTFKDSDISYEEWTAMFDKNSYAALNLVTYPDKNRQTVDIFYQIPQFLDKFDAMAVFSVDTSAILNNAKMVMENYSDIGIFVLSKDGEVIMTNGVVDSIPQNSKDCTVIKTVSDTIGWRYVSVIPSGVYEKKLEYFKLINIFNIFIFFILCGFLSYFFAKRNARPFGVLKQIYSNNENENDLTLINNALNDYRSVKQAQSEIEQSHLMEELINTGRPKILDELKKYKIDFPYQYFCVILFKLVNVSKLFEDENDISSLQKYDSVKLIIKNVLEEIINEKHCAYICNINGQIVAVVNINHDLLLDFHSELEEMLSRGREFISSRFAFSYTPFVGGIYDVKTLHRSYSEAINALQYRTFIPTSDIVFCEDMKTESNSSEVSAAIPAEKTKQLINLLRLGDAETSISMVNSLMLSAPSDAPITYRVILFDLICTLIRAVEIVGGDEAGTEISEELSHLAGISDKDEVLEKVNGIIKELCILSSKRDQENGAKKTDEALPKKDIMSEIKSFINDNYANQSLNIAMIGDYFNITPYYVSNIFKKSENVSMLDYINITRINKAKELLTTTDLTVESVALQCGFSNIRTFMRVFQKFEVITPGKYKEMNKN